MSRILFASKQKPNTVGRHWHEQAIISTRQLFAGHVVDFRPMKRKNKLHRLIIKNIGKKMNFAINYSTSKKNLKYSNNRHVVGHHH